MSRRDDATWVADMLEIVQRVLEEVKDISYEEYLSDSRLRRAIP